MFILIIKAITMLLVQLLALLWAGVGGLGIWFVWLYVVQRKVEQSLLFSIMASLVWGVIVSVVLGVDIVLAVSLLGLAGALVRRWPQQRAVFLVSITLTALFTLMRTTVFSFESISSIAIEVCVPLFAYQLTKLSFFLLQTRSRSRQLAT